MTVNAVTQYIGARYVPLFAEPLEWTNDRVYEPLTIVLHEGASYTSRQSVPLGIDISNEQYWALTGNYNAQVEQYRLETREAVQHVDEVGAQATESATQAANSAAAAKTSEGNAATSATAAAGSATAAANSATQAANSATQAASSAAAAKTSEDNVAATISAATEQAVADSTKAAADSAAAAAQSATNAASSATAAERSANSAHLYSDSASGSATTANTLAANAQSYANEAAESAASVSSSASQIETNRKNIKSLQDNYQYGYFQGSESEVIAAGATTAIEIPFTKTYSVAPNCAFVMSREGYTSTAVDCDYSIADITANSIAVNVTNRTNASISKKFNLYWLVLGGQYPIN